jgi:hypothetical protein
MQLRFRAPDLKEYSSMTYLHTVQADVLTCIEKAKWSALEEEIEGVIEWLSKAVSIYEENPSAVHERESQLADLLFYIEATVRACDACEFEDAAAELQVRATALQAPIH